MTTEPTREAKPATQIEPFKPKSSTLYQILAPPSPVTPWFVAMGITVLLGILVGCFAEPDQDAIRADVHNIERHVNSVDYRQALQHRRP